MNIFSWSKFYDFKELYEYHGHFDLSGGSSRGLTTFNGQEGYPHSDGGFRLRSTPGGRLSFSSIPLKLSIENLSCPLFKGEIGCYFVRVRVGSSLWDYIGKSAELKRGISDRLREHLIKVAGTSEIHHVTPTKKFSKLHYDLKQTFSIDPNTAEFFDQHVQLAFIKVNREAKPHIQQLHVSKIEGMALAQYRQIKGHFPNLNDTDETKGLDGLKALITSA